MPVTNVFYELRRHLEKLGFDLDVTLRTLSLTTPRDTVTGWYGKSFADSTIRMVIIPKGAQFLIVPMGLFVTYDATGLTDQAIVEGDEIKDQRYNYYVVEAVQTHLFGGSAVMYECALNGPMCLHPLADYWLEEISNGSFESDFTDWTQGGTPTIDTVVFRTGAKSSKFDAVHEYVEQTIDNVPVADITTFSVYLRGNTSFSPAYGSPWKITVTYSDATTTEILYTTVVKDAWEQVNIASSLTAGKIVTKVKIELDELLGGGYMGPGYVEDVTLIYKHTYMSPWDHGPFEQFWEHFSKFGFSCTITLRRLQLGTPRDSVTGWYVKSYVETTEHMVIVPKAMRTEVLKMGLMPIYELNGYCDCSISEGDQVLHNSIYYNVKSVQPFYVGDKLAMNTCELERIKLGAFAT